MDFMCKVEDQKTKVVCENSFVKWIRNNRIVASKELLLPWAEIIVFSFVNFRQMIECSKFALRKSVKKRYIGKNFRLRSSQGIDINFDRLGYRRTSIYGSTNLEKRSGKKIAVDI